jgi:hypothetical protein
MARERTESTWTMALTSSPAEISRRERSGAGTT